MPGLDTAGFGRGLPRARAADRVPSVGVLPGIFPAPLLPGPPVR